MASWILVNISSVNSLAPGKCCHNLKSTIFETIIHNSMLGKHCGIAFRIKPQNLSDMKSTLVWVMVWCLQATSHYLNQCWPMSMSPYNITRPQWVNDFCLMAPNHHLNQCWLLVGVALWQSYGEAANHYQFMSENHILKLNYYLPGVDELKGVLPAHVLSPISFVIHWPNQLSAPGCLQFQIRVMFLTKTHVVSYSMWLLLTNRMICLYFKTPLFPWWNYPASFAPHPLWPVWLVSVSDF